jgi:hypothetical protein
MDILNFISWIKAGKYITTAPLDAVTVIGVPNTTRGDAYLPATVPITTFQTNIGKFIGGGIVVSEWFENGVHKALIVALQDVSVNAAWTVTAQQGVYLPSADSFSDGFNNTNAIIAQTGAPAAITYAAGLARLYLDGGYNDWYLPSAWELTLCYNSSAIINKTIVGIGNGFGASAYWSSTGYAGTDALTIDFFDGVSYLALKNSGQAARAVRTHTF